MKKFTEKDLNKLEGILLKRANGYTLFNLGKIEKIIRVNAVKMIDSIDIQERNSLFLEGLKKRVNTYGEDGFNEFGFDENGKTRDGSEINENGLDAKGWKTIKRDGNRRNDKQKITYNQFTGTEWDLEGYNKKGFNEEGYDKEGYDIKGKDREGYYRNKFNDERIHKVTGTIWDTEGYDFDGYNREGYNRNKLNRKGRTKEEIKDTKNKQRRNFIGLTELANGYAKGEITIEQYLKSSKTSIEDLIIFARKQKMDKKIIVGLYGKKREYNMYRTMFNKFVYLKDKTTINGVEITEELVDKVINYLKANDRLLCTKIVNEHIRDFVNGKIDLDNQKQEGKDIKRTEQNKDLKISDDSMKKIANDTSVAMQKQNAKSDVGTLKTEQKLNKHKVQAISEG